VIFHARAATAANDPLSLHDALPIFHGLEIILPSLLLWRIGGLVDQSRSANIKVVGNKVPGRPLLHGDFLASRDFGVKLVCDFLRSEEHTSELQSPYDLVCRLLLEKK